MRTWAGRQTEAKLLAHAARGCLIVIVFGLLTTCGQPLAPRTLRASASSPRAPVLTGTAQTIPASLAALASQSQRMRFDHLPPDAGLSQSVVVDFLQDNQGFLWLATQDGLNRYDGYEFKIFKDDPTNPDGLKGNFAASIEKDPAGKIWIGTNDGGLNCYDPQTGRFTSFLNDPKNPNSLSENSVPAVAVDQAGMVWAGTNNSGLNRLDPRSGQITRYRHLEDVPNSLGDDNISSLVLDPDGALWVGTIGSGCLLYTSPSPRDRTRYRMPSSA